MTTVSIYKPDNCPNFNGKGSKDRYFERTFNAANYDGNEDLARRAAEAWAQDQVETKGALYAKVVTR